MQAWYLYHAFIVPCTASRAFTARATVAPINSTRSASRACKGGSRAFYGYAVQCIYIIVLIAQWYISVWFECGESSNFHGYISNPKQYQILCNLVFNTR